MRIDRQDGRRRLCRDYNVWEMDSDTCHDNAGKRLRLSGRLDNGPPEARRNVVEGVTRWMRAWCIVDWMATEAMEEAWNKQMSRMCRISGCGEISLTQGACVVWKKVRVARKCNQGDLMAVSYSESPLAASLDR